MQSSRDTCSGRGNVCRAIRASDVHIHTRELSSNYSPFVPQHKRHRIADFNPSVGLPSVELSCLTSLRRLPIIDLQSDPRGVKSRSMLYK